MKPFRRIAMSVAVLAVFVAASTAARAQVLNLVPQDALVVIKLNNPEAVSKKLAALAQKLGLAQMEPRLGDPLSFLRQQAGLKDGLDAKGEAAVAILKPAPGEQEPQFVALVPVTDYKAFLTNFADVKKDGTVDTFTMPENSEQMFASNWGKYAAVSLWKGLVSKQGTGVKVEGAVGKQLTERDVTAIANMSQIRPLIMPQFLQMKQFIPQIPMVDAQGNEMVFQKQMTIQTFNGIEQFLNELQTAAVSLNLADPGMTMTWTYQFDPQSGLGKTMASLRNSDATILNGLPQDKYLFFGGFAFDGKRVWNWMREWYVPALKQAKLTPAEQKSIDELIAASDKMWANMTSMSFGFIPPAPGAAGKQGLVRGVMVMQGNAKAIKEASATMYKHNDVVMKATGAPGITMKTTVTPNAKTFGGVQMDAYKMDITGGPNADPNAMKFIQFLYGNNMSGYMGMANDKTVISTVGLDDAKAQSAVAAAKGGQAPLAQNAQVKTALSQLPQNRLGVLYVDVANVVNTGMQIAQQFGAGVGNMKMPPELPPVAIGVATEGSAIRFDTYVPTDLVESLMSFGMQMQMQQQMRRQNQDGL